MDKLIKKILHFLHINMSEAKEEAFIQFVKFGIVGASNTILSYAINLGVLFALKPLNVKWDIFAGNIVSFVLSVLWSFFWNNKFVFTKKDGEKRSIIKSLLKTYVSYGFTGFILANILSFIWVNLLGISKLIAPLLNLVISVPVNFILNKFWAYKSDKKADNCEE